MTTEKRQDIRERRTVLGSQPGRNTEAEYVLREGKETERDNHVTP